MQVTNSGFKSSQNRQNLINSQNEVFSFNRAKLRLHIQKCDHQNFSLLPKFPSLHFISHPPLLISYHLLLQNNMLKIIYFFLQFLYSIKLICLILHNSRVSRFLPSSRIFAAEFLSYKLRPWLNRFFEHSFFVNLEIFAHSMWLWWCLYMSHKFSNLFTLMMSFEWLSTRCSQKAWISLGCGLVKIFGGSVTHGIYQPP